MLIKDKTPLPADFTTLKLLSELELWFTALTPPPTEPKLAELTLAPLTANKSSPPAPASTLTTKLAWTIATTIWSQLPPDNGTPLETILWAADCTTTEPSQPSELLTAITLTKLEEVFADHTAPSTAT